jgi:Txe/YoeB family toxin of toxin-antitoxin system
VRECLEKTPPARPQGTAAPCSPPYEKLVGDLAGAYSRRINIQHRLVYQVYEKEQAVKIIRMWTQYE